jgi:hypothetical protein
MATIAQIQPTTNEVLSNGVIGYRNPAFQLQEVAFPVVGVNKRVGSFYKFGKEAFDDEADYISPSGDSPRLTRGLSQDTYTLRAIGAAVEIPWDTIDEADGLPIVDELKSSQYVMDKIGLKIERLIVSALATTGNWTTTAAIVGGQEWDTSSGGNPIAAVETAKITVKGLIGIKPNLMVLTERTAWALRTNAVLRDYVKYGGAVPSVLTMPILQELFDIERIVVADGMYNTAAKDLTVSLAPILTDTAWIGYAPSSPGIMVPAAGYVFTKNGEAPIRTYQEPKNRRNVVDGVKHWGVKVTAADAGYTITNCLSAI